MTTLRINGVLTEGDVVITTNAVPIEPQPVNPPPIIPPPVIPPVTSGWEMDWIPFNTTGFFPADQPGIQISGDTGFALRVYADAVKFPNGINLSMWDQTPQGVMKEVTISQSPHAYALSGPNYMAGIQAGPRGICFYSPGVTPGPNDAIVTANQYFFINLRERPYPGSPRDQLVSAQFSAQAR